MKKILFVLLLMVTVGLNYLHVSGLAYNVLIVQNNLGMLFSVYLLFTVICDISTCCVLAYCLALRIVKIVKFMEVNV